MAAQPIIVYASASVGTTGTLIEALIRTNARGMVQMRGYLSASCTTEDTAMRQDWCVEQQNTTYIANLYQRVHAFKPATTTALSVCLRAVACSSGENCDTITCSTWSSGYTSELTNIPMSDEFGNTPIAVSDLTLTPGNGTISASWGDVDQTTSIWAYEIQLLQGTTGMATGYITKNNITIGNLTNGTTYTVAVRAHSFDGYSGPWSEKSATPVVPCVDFVSNINIV